jgi:thioredoxin-like negative regulator of GroEL
MISDTNYKEVLAEGRHMVFLWKKGCPHCKDLGRAALGAEQWFSDIRFHSMLSSDGPAFLRATAVDAFPTLLLFEDGVMKKRMTGVFPTERIIEWVTSSDVKDARSEKACDFCSEVREKLRPRMPKLVAWLDMRFPLGGLDAR